MRLLLLLLALAGCPAQIPQSTFKDLGDPRDRELVLGVGDVVAINVWGQDNKELNTEAKIRPDGTITMPLVGDIKALGQTPSVLKEKIKGELGKFLKLAAGTEVTVAVKNWNSYRYTVSGEVTKPGIYNSDQYLRVSQVIAQSGGLTRFATRRCELFRDDPKTKDTKNYPLDYDDLASGKRPDMDIFVLPGDKIYCP